MFNLKTSLVLMGSLIVILIYQVEGQEVTLDMIIALENQIQQLSSDYTSCQTQISDLNGYLQGQIQQEANDVNNLNQYINQLQSDLSAVNQRSSDNSVGIATLQGDIGGLAAALGESNGRIEKLETNNKIWRANFQVVNKTFGELRKKLKIVVPIIQLPVIQPRKPKTQKTG